MTLIETMLKLADEHDLHNCQHLLNCLRLAYQAQRRVNFLEARERYLDEEIEKLWLEKKQLQRKLHGEWSEDHDA